MDTSQLHLVPGAAAGDAGEVARLRAEIDARNRQETAVAELGQAALTGVDPLILLGQACALIESTLAVDHCRALELTPGGQLLVRAAIGSNDTFLHCERDAEEDESLGMYVILSEAPVMFAQFDDTRFQSDHLRAYHHIEAGAGVRIPTPHGSFGALLAYSSRPRVFEEYELAFLKSCANLVGEALARSRAESALRKSELRLKQLIASTLDAVVTIDRGGHIIEWNPQAEVTFGLRAREVMGQPVPAAIVPRRFQRLLELLQKPITRGPADTSGRRVRRGAMGIRTETVARRANGDEFPAELTVDRIGSGSDTTFTAFIRDISVRKRAERELAEREQRFRTLVEKSWSGLLLLDAQLHFSYASAPARALLGYDESELISKHLFDFVHPRERDQAKEIFTTLAAAPNTDSQGELRFLHRNGKWVWLEGYAQNLLHDPTVKAIVFHYRDVTQRKAAEKRIEYQNFYDALTGLPNRVLFRDRVVNAIAHARRNRRGITVMHLDLDHFKLVNDALGQSIGDKLLSGVAQRLQACLRASDTIARAGGDEFMILLSEVGEGDAASNVARKMLQALERPFLVEGHELFVMASIGISLYPGDGLDVEALVKAADSAMYRAKELGRNQAQLFTPSLNERYVRRLALEQSLHYAIERQELELFYQPIYDRARRRVASLEALIRWMHPEKGIVPPAEFIGLAEESGLIVPIGAWVLRTACQQLRLWRDSGLAGLRVAVNISAVQFQQPDFVELVLGALEQQRVDPNDLQLEITETVAVQNIERTLQVLQELRTHGITVAVDDFGTGQSSLIYLKQFPIDTIKIDQAFVRNMVEDESDAAIVSNVITLAHSMKLSVVAEGVETEGQYSLLRHFGCDFMQGYLFSRPIPSGRVLDFVTNGG